jgi:predicted metal-dependent peptidase
MAKTNDPKFFIKLRSQIMRGWPGLANLIFKVEYSFSDSFPTAATDGFSTWYNSKFMDMLSERSQMVVVGHEVLHAAFLHAQTMRRLPKKKIDKGNIAADFLVNSFLKEIGLADDASIKELTEACGVFFLNDKYNVVDYSFEKLMNELPDDQKKCEKLGKTSGKSPKIQGNGFSDIIIKEGKGDKDGNGEPTQAEIDRANEMRQAIVQAVNQHKQQMKKMGKGAGWLDRFLDNLLEPKIDWKKELFDFFHRTIKDESSMRRPNRRYLPSGFYFPIKFGVGAGTVGVAVDLSGSIGQQEVDIFMSELSHIFTVCQPEKVVLVGFDDGIRFVQELEEFDPSLKIKGGGGTDFRPVFKEFNKHEIEALVFMTDMYGPFPDKSDFPEYPVLFLSTSDVKDAPFGRVVQYEINHK